MRGRGPHARRSFGLYPRVGVVRVLRRAVGIFTTAIFFCAFTILVLEQIGLNFFELYYILHGFLTLFPRPMNIYRYGCCVEPRRARLVVGQSKPTSDGRAPVELWAGPPAASPSSGGSRQPTSSGSRARRVSILLSSTEHINFMLFNFIKSRILFIFINIYMIKFCIEEEEEVCVQGFGSWVAL